VTLDCFDPYLPRLYNAYGFQAYDAWAFNDEYAPAGWDFEKFGRPDVVFMRYEGSRDRAEILRKAGSFGEYQNPADAQGYPAGHEAPDGESGQGAGRGRQTDGFRRLSEYGYASRSHQVGAERSEIIQRAGTHGAYENPADRIEYPEGNGPLREDSGDLREGRSGRVLPENGVDYLVASPGGERGAQLQEAARLLWLGYP
jgi:hypothetical protein